MTLPFRIASNLSTLTYPFPPPSDLLEVLKSSNRREREAIARLWLSEGVPHAFWECPVLFEEIRSWLADRLPIHPKDITVIGSARIGYSLASREFGRPFGKKSDLDLSIISQSLFRSLQQAAQQFAADYQEGIVVPYYPREHTYWPQNIDAFPTYIGKGFLDSHQIPNRDRYAIVKCINGSMAMLTRKLHVTPGAPTMTRASARVYRDWKCFVNQVSRNLWYAMQESGLENVKIQVSNLGSSSNE